MDQVRIIDHEVVGVSLKIVTRVQLAECDQGDTGGEEANDQEVDREVGQGVLLHVFQHQILHELWATYRSDGLGRFEFEQTDSGDKIVFF